MGHFCNVLSRHSSSYSSKKVAFVRAPSSVLNEGIVTHIEQSSINIEKAVSQWETYCSIFRQEGWQTIEVPPPSLNNDSHPDSVFIEDVILVNNQNDRILITHPGASRRVGELNNIYDFLTEEMSIDRNKVFYLNERGEESTTLDGGDILKIPSMNLLYVGKGGRTSLKGIEKLKQIFSKETIIEVPITKVLHCKSAFTALPNTQIIVWPPSICSKGLSSIDTNFNYVSNIENKKVSTYTGSAAADNKQGKVVMALEEAGAHVVILDHDTKTLLMASSASKTAAMLERTYGYKVILVDITEFEKLEGCVTCLSVRIRDFDKLL